jgi:hypothetical protein
MYRRKSRITGQRPFPQEVLRIKGTLLWLCEWRGQNDEKP